MPDESLKLFILAIVLYLTVSSVFRGRQHTRRRQHTRALRGAARAHRQQLGTQHAREPWHGSGVRRRRGALYVQYRYHEYRIMYRFTNGRVQKGHQTSSSRSVAAQVRA